MGFELQIGIENQDVYAVVPVAVFDNWVHNLHHEGINPQDNANFQNFDLPGVHEGGISVGTDAILLG